MDENAGTAGDALQTWQSRPPSRRPSAGRAGKAWRNHVEAQGIFARGNGRMRPRSGRFECGHGRLSALSGEKQHPLRAPGQVGGAAQTNQCRHLEKIDVVNEIRAPLAAPVTNIEGMPPRSPRGTTATLAARQELKRHAPRSPHRTTANPAARRERESPIGPPCDARRELQRHAPPKPQPHNRKARGTAGAWKEAEGRTPTARRGIVRRPAACIGLSPLGAVPAHAAQQSVGRLRTALRQGGIASLARDNPIGRLRVQRPRLRRHRPLSGAHRPFGEG